MKTMLALALSLVASSAFAHYDARNMTCSEVQNVVATEGAAVIWTNDHIYDRYVAHDGFCDRASHEITKPAYLQTSDGVCWVGYTCEQSNGGGD